MEIPKLDVPGVSFTFDKSKRRYRVCFYRDGRRKKITLKTTHPGRAFKEAYELAEQFNAGRYQWVKKRFDGTEVVAGATKEHAIVYSRGTLYGVWPDGEAFEGNRYVDRYVLRDGLIVEMDVWNDSAERLLDKSAAGGR